MSVHPQPAPDASATRPAWTLPRLREASARGEKLVMLTCYDATFSRVLDEAGVDILLVGDSLGNVIQGEASTLPVTLEQMAYHTRAVAQGKRSAFLVTDLPFGTYEASPEQAFASAATLMRAGAQMVKLEGGGYTAETVRFLTERGIPVCAHIGLTPQFVHQLGGYRVQGKTDEGAEQLKRDALALQEAGAAMVLLEAVPAALGKEVTGILQVPTIGIGAGPDCSGQVLVMHDLLGVFPGRKARFVKNFMEGQTSIDAAVQAYVAAVKDGSFPAPEHCF